MIGQDLVTAVSILSNSQPQDVIERLGKGILELTGFKDVFDLVSKYGLNATTATAIALKLFPLPVLSPIVGPIGIPIGGPVRIPIGFLIGIPISIPIGPINVPVPVPPLVGIIGGLVGLFSKNSAVQNTAAAWALSPIAGRAISHEAVPVPLMASMAFDNSSTFDARRAPQHSTQALEAAATALQAAREALQRAEEAYNLAVAASLAAGMEKSAITEATPVSSADVSAEQVSAIDTADVSEESLRMAAGSTEAVGPLQPESAESETSQIEPSQAEPLHLETQEPATTAPIDTSMLPTTTADGTQIVWVSEDELTQLIEQQRVALLDAALSLYPIEEVYEASKANFDDTTPEQIQAYLTAAGVEEHEIKEFSEPVAEERSA